MQNVSEKVSANQANSVNLSAAPTRDRGLGTI